MDGAGLLTAASPWLLLADGWTEEDVTRLTLPADANVTLALRQLHRRLTAPLAAIARRMGRKSVSGAGWHGGHGWSTVSVSGQPGMVEFMIFSHLSAVWFDTDRVSVSVCGQFDSEQTFVSAALLAVAESLQAGWSAGWLSDRSSAVDGDCRVLPGWAQAWPTLTDSIQVSGLVGLEVLSGGHSGGT